jgi:hypothetical protein
MAICFGTLTYGFVISRRPENVVQGPLQIANLTLVAQQRMYDGKRSLSSAVAPLPAYTQTSAETKPHGSMMPMRSRSSRGRCWTVAGHDPPRYSTVPHSTLLDFLGIFTNLPGVVLDIVESRSGPHGLPACRPVRGPRPFEKACEGWRRRQELEEDTWTS